MPHRYEILDEIPNANAFVEDQLNQRRGLRPDDRRRQELLIGAGDAALYTLGKLTHDAALWLALQRQVLVQGWRFEDLAQLDQLAVTATADLLVLLQVGPQTSAERLATGANAQRLVTNAKNEVRTVQDAVKWAAAADGISLPRSQEETLLIDHAHNRVYELWLELGGLLHRARQEQLSKADQHRMLVLCTAAVSIAGSIAAVALQLPEVQRLVVHLATDLTEALGRVAEPLRAGVAMLGIVVAVRQSDIALDATDEDPPWNGLLGPNGDWPSGKPAGDGRPSGRPTRKLLS
jgi:hypothetical protein